MPLSGSRRTRGIGGVGRRKLWDNKPGMDGVYGCLGYTDDFTEWLAMIGAMIGLL